MRRWIIQKQKFSIKAVKVEEVICVLRRIMGQLFFFSSSAECELFRLSLQRVLAALQTETSIIQRNKLQHLGPARLHVFFVVFFPLFSYFSPLKVEKVKARREMLWKQSVQLIRWTLPMFTGTLHRRPSIIAPLARLIFPPFAPVASIHFSIFLKAGCCLLLKMLTHTFGQTSRGPK